MVAISRKTLRSLWQLFCTDHKCKITAFQSYFYYLKLKKNGKKEYIKRFKNDHVMLNITEWKWHIDQSEKHHYLNDFIILKALAVVLSTPRFFAIDTAIGSHWESVDNSSFMLYKLWYNQVELNNKIDKFWKRHYWMILLN